MTKLIPSLLNALCNYTATTMHSILRCNDLLKLCKFNKLRYYYFNSAIFFGSSECFFDVALVNFLHFLSFHEILPLVSLISSSSAFSYVN
ncbi:hypothetical protein DICVIV_06377 [Dictyocaulus viviparus]|uniref:Uncharacterized protein n=1 Tax=Dictyocaulus viviparus TaxID=29172 RepID=A0A0D8XYV5_DICVI|nr:hypothetical protein DICVIV_06377 [Dictyocaulus viviparus]